MKRYLVLLAVVAALVVPVASFALIGGSMHDFGSGGLGGAPGTGASPNNTATGWDEICVPCHTPHNSLENNPVPLWNHITSGAGFTSYGNPAGTMQAVAGAVAGVSLRCLSCHDGATNVDGYQNSPGGAGGSIPMPPNPVGGPYPNLGIVLNNDHPISIDYTVSDAGDAEIAGIAAPLAAGMLAPDAGGNLVMVECSSCHDVHNTVGPGVKLLRMSNADSALCLTCHIK